MIYKIDKESEEDFNAWLESISFVDEEGIVQPVTEVETEE